MKRLIQTTFQSTLCLAVLITASLLNACGGSGGSSVIRDAAADSKLQTETGTFLPGPIKGLQYESTSHSGVTNERGEFQYEPGETITFSVGGIVLGAAPGAKQITPFDFFGMSPPDTELVVRNYVESVAVTDFDRASNITFFLLLLDKDGDPGNGLEVSAWNQTLANASLSFDEHFYYFYETDEFSDLRAGTGPWYRGYATAALPYLYEQLSITVPAHALSELVTDDDEDGSVESREVYVYNALGLRESVSTDTGDTGNYNNVVQYSFDARGRLVKEERRRDNDDDGTTNEVVVSTMIYDDFGRTVETRRETDQDADGIPESISIITQQWNEEGNRSYRESRNTATWSVDQWDYNERGLVTAAHSQSGTTGTDTPKSRTETSYSYDPDTGLLLAREEKVDNANDGTFEGTKTTIYRYDSEGREVEQVYTEFYDSWTSSQVTTATRSYDDAGNILEVRISYDPDDDGSPESTKVETYTYDYSQVPGGRLVRYHYGHDSNANGVFDEQELREITYGDNGLPEKIVSKFDNDADTNFDTVSTSTFVFDDNGRVIEEFREEINEGALASRYMQERSYDQNGNLLTERDREDTDLDGNWDVTDLLQYSYEPLEDGLFHILSSWQ
ncbi:hypothetical protein ACXYTJ_10170 [Gilvimarinus sp. F26214L]|uniref:hypothetical protein n=1 Tax=Gilvimarinus sp. DZF01 TaxID=3461371 RepID=UPI004045EB59